MKSAMNSLPPVSSKLEEHGQDHLFVRCNTWLIRSGFQPVIYLILVVMTGFLVEEFKDRDYINEYVALLNQTAA